MLSGLRKGDNEEFTVQQNPANKSQHNTLYSLTRTVSRGKSGKIRVHATGCSANSRRFWRFLT